MFEFACIVLLIIVLFSSLLWYLNKCSHRYREIDRFIRSDISGAKKVYINQCLICGKMKRFKI